MKKLVSLLVALLSVTLISCDKTPANAIVSSTPTQTNSVEVSSSSTSKVSSVYEERRLKYNIPEGYVLQSETYYKHDEVAAYLAIYNALPSNYKETVKESGDVRGYHTFENREGLLPSELTYTEIDVNTYYPNQRGRHRICYSNNYRIFYTDDHYNSFVEYVGYNNWNANYN